MSDTCEFEIAFTDFDGARAEAVCGLRAAKRITFDSPQFASYVESLGGWEEYRQAELVGWGELEEASDPGEDPGRENWGHSTLTLCAEHARAIEDNEQGDLVAVEELSGN